MVVIITKILISNLQGLFYSLYSFFVYFYFSSDYVQFEFHSFLMLWMSMPIILRVFICFKFTLSGRVMGAVGGQSCSLKNGGPAKCEYGLLTSFLQINNVKWKVLIQKYYFKCRNDFFQGLNRSMLFNKVVTDLFYYKCDQLSKNLILKLEFWNSI